MSKVRTMSSDFREWETEILNPALRRMPERQPAFFTQSGLEVERVYVSEDGRGSEGGRLDLPGRYPYTRGVQPTMYRGRLWTMRQYSGFSTAEQSNRRFRYLLCQGTTGLSVAFDLPTQIGYDSDDRMSVGEVGKVGVAIDSLEDMEKLLHEVPLDRVSTSMTINSTASILLAMYAAVAEKQGVSLSRVQGTIQNDILKEYIARGTYIFPPSASLKLTTDTIKWCRATMPCFNPISVSGYHIREAGATAVQELGFTLANARTYVDAARKAGIGVDEIAPRMSFFFNVSSDFFEEVAKFRAARRLWARLMKERFGAREPSSFMLRFHSQTSGYSLCAQQSGNNVVRVALQALAAVLGGTQSLHTNSRDEALALPSEEAVRLAVRTQQIIANETNVCSTVDPLGGSYYVEELTCRLERDAMELMEEVEVEGGMVKAIESGFVVRRIDEAGFKQQRAVDTGGRTVVGVNQFCDKEPDAAMATGLGERGQDEQLQSLRLLRLRRDNSRVGLCLHDLRAKAIAGDNVMPAIFDAVKAYGTVGEICEVLRSVYGEYQDEGVLKWAK